MKKTIVAALAVAVVALFALAPSAHARRGDDVPVPPECQIEDGGILVCK